MKRRSTTRERSSGKKVVDVEEEKTDSDSDFQWVHPSRRAREPEKKAEDKSQSQESSKKPIGATDYVIEQAKSGRAECRRCGEKIPKNSVRVGMVIQGDRWTSVNWKHLACTVFPPSVQVAESLDGYHSLPSDMKQEVLRRIQESTDEIDPDLVPVDPSELVRTTWSEEMEPANELLMPLLPYQKEGLSWMINQENSSMRGGILADEMGMGKTIQAISVILSNKRNTENAQQAKVRHQAIDEYKQLMASTLQAKKGKVSEGQSLVIVPTVALRQWHSEILRFTKEGSVSVAIYHGTERGELTQRMLMKADIVLTTYKILEMEFRNATADSKMSCSVCGKKYYPDKYRLHRKYYCGDSSRLTEAQSKTERKSKFDNIKKNSRGQKSKQSAHVLDEDSDSEVDVLDSKRSLISSSKKGQTTGTSRNKGKVRGGRGFPGDRDGEEANEDEVAFQKKKRRNGKNNKPSAAKPRGRSKAKGKRKTLQDESSEGDSEDGDVRPKKTKHVKNKTKRRRGRAGVSSDSDFEEEEEEDWSGGETPPQPKKRKRSAGGGGSACKPKANDGPDDPNEELDSEVEREISLAMKESTKQAVPSLLHCICWFRIVLDEAHLIKDRSSSTSKAVFHLASSYKWCLTGTPLQNRVGELYSLVRFLRIDPHAYYYCRAKDCDCKSLHYRFTRGRCDECSHTAMQHFSHFNKHILNPIQRCGYIGQGRQGMLTLKNEVLDKVLLRRTKDTRADDIQLPPRIVNVRMDGLDAFEEDFYEAMYTQSQAQFNTYVEAGTVLHNYAHIFDILIRLRQVVDHPYLVLHSASKATNETSIRTLADMDNENALNALRDDSKSSGNCDDSGDTTDATLCGFCHEPPISPVSARCSHVYCESCVTDYLKVMEESGARDSRAICPICEEPISLIISQTVKPAREEAYMPQGLNVGKGRKSFINKLDLTKFQSSTKLEALMQELHVMRKRDLGAKAIVFSQFVNMLDLTEYRLRLGGFGCGKLTGSLTVDQRDKILQSFNSDPELSVLLISLKAGGVALNLTAANHIFIMDPWWNPAAEMQAIDRTHRIGQHKPIYATRFIVHNTIEERILQLQEKKRLVFDGTIGGDAGSMARLTVEDMRFLFQ